METKVFVCLEETEADGIQVDRVFDTLEKAQAEMRRQVDYHTRAMRKAKKHCEIDWLTGAGGRWGWYDTDRMFSYYVYEKCVE